MAGDRQRILVIGPRGISGDEGGVEKFAEEFIRRAARVADVSVLCLEPSATRLPPGIEEIHVARSRLLKTDKALYVVEGMRQCMSRDFDCVFIMGMNFAILVLPIRLIFWRRPRVFVRSGSIDYKVAKWGRIMRAVMHVAEWSMRFAHGVIAVAPSIQRHLTRQGIDSVLIRNGLALRPDGASLPSRVPGTVVAVGRLTQQKNFRVLIEAAGLLGETAVAITIVGGADLTGEAEMLQVAAEAHAPGRLTFSGAKPRADVIDMLGKMALYVNCSLHEGMSNAVLEAIQERIPVLLSDIEANRDLALPEHHYFPATDPAALALKIKDALASPEQYLVDPALFDDWDRVSATILRHLALDTPLVAAPATALVRADPE
jgi:glycosyltransferase involved in cell wall biosynthesis